MLDPVDHPNWWIMEGIDRVRAKPCWCKEIRASKNYTMQSGLRRCIKWENFSKPEALHYTQWQVEASRLPLAQHEALGWWDAPPWLCGLCPQDFLPHTDTSSTRNFWAMRQEKTQPRCCSAVLRGLGANQSPLQCGEGTPEMHVPPMNLTEDDIIEASPLGTCRWGMWNLPHAGGGSHPPGQGTWGTRGPRECCIPSRMSGDPWTCRTHQVD